MENMDAKNLPNGRTLTTIVWYSIGYIGYIIIGEGKPLGRGRNN